jgi:hypothetical protein
VAANNRMTAENTVFMGPILSQSTPIPATACEVANTFNWFTAENRFPIFGKTR